MIKKIVSIVVVALSLAAIAHTAAATPATAAAKCAAGFVWDNHHGQCVPGKPL